MTAVAVGSVKGAPGVTTTILAMAAVWPSDRRLLVAEFDPDGGVVAARRALGFDPGLVTAIASLLRGDGRLDGHTQPLSDSVGAIVAPSTAEQVRASVAAGGDLIGPALLDGNHDVLIDCGRLSAPSPTLTVARHADTVLLLLRPRLEDIALVRDRLAPLHRAGIDPHLVLIDDGPYRTEEVSAAIDAPVRARLPVDHRTADALNGVTAQHRLNRSRLLRGVRGLVDAVVAENRERDQAPAEHA